MLLHLAPGCKSSNGLNARRFKQLAPFAPHSFFHFPLKFPLIKTRTFTANAYVGEIGNATAHSHPKAQKDMTTLSLYLRLAFSKEAVYIKTKKMANPGEEGVSDF